MAGTLPKLIFVDDDHTNAFFKKLLMKMIPKLKALGYETFQDEIPGSFTKIEDIIKLNEINEAKDKNNLALFERLQLGKIFYEFLEAKGYLNFNKEFDENTFDDVINQYIDQNNPFAIYAAKLIARMLSGWEDLLVIHPPSISLEINQFIKELSHKRISPEDKEYKKAFINFIANKLSLILIKNEIISAQTNQALFQMMLNHHINYSVVEVDKTLLASLQLFFKKTNAIEFCQQLDQGIDRAFDLSSELNIKRRDKKMIDAYLSCKQAVFGRVGFIHMDGMSNLIPLDEKHNFCFIYIPNPVAKLSPELEAIELNKAVDRATETINKAILLQKTKNEILNAKKLAQPSQKNCSSTFFDRQAQADFGRYKNQTNNYRIK